MAKRVGTRCALPAKCRYVSPPSNGARPLGFAIHRDKGCTVRESCSLSGRMSLQARRSWRGSGRTSGGQSEDNVFHVTPAERVKRSFDSAALRSGFRLRAPASLTPAKRLRLRLIGAWVEIACLPGTHVPGCSVSLLRSWNSQGALRGCLH